MTAVQLPTRDDKTLKAIHSVLAQHDDQGEGDRPPITLEDTLATIRALVKPETKTCKPEHNPHRRHYVNGDGTMGHVFKLAHGSRGELEDAKIGMMIGLDALCCLTHSASVLAGWYTDPATGNRLQRNLGEMLALIHSEVSEAMEGVRKNTFDDHLPERLAVEVELADAVIRIGDFCGYLGLDLAGAVAAKMAYNSTRLDHKLETRREAGGKAF